MNTSEPKEPVSGVIHDLEQQLSAARKEKTLARVPALRRLRNVVRFYGVICIVFSLPSIVFTGAYLRGLHSAVNSQEPTLTSFSTFFLFAALQWIVAGIGLLTMFSYLRFLKQFRENQVHDIKDTTAMILRLWKFVVGFGIINSIMISAAMSRFSFFAASSQNPVGGAISGLISLVVFYFVIRHYVKTAQAELPLLAATAGDNAPRRNYRPWKSLFLMLMVVAVVILGFGYWLGGVLSGANNTVSVNSEANADQFLAETSKAINASLPMQVDSETRLDTTTSGPGKRVTYFFTLVNLSVADLNQTELIKKMTEQLVDNYRSNPSMAEFRRMQVELSYVYRDKRGETVATIIVSPRDL